jgi:hypothetical protein
MLPFRGIIFGGKPNELTEEKVAREAHNNRVKMLGKAVGDLRGARRDMELQQIPAGPPRNYFLKREDLKVWRGGEDFPYAWIDIEIFCGNLIKSLQDTKKHSTSLRRAMHDLAYASRLQGSLSKQAWQARLMVMRAAVKTAMQAAKDRRTQRYCNRFKAEARQWVERGTKAGRFAKVDDAARHEFHAWYDGIIALSDDVARDPYHWTVMQRSIAEAYRVGPRLCLAHSAEAAALVSAAWLADQRWQWAIRYEEGKGIIYHQLLGPREHIADQEQSKEGVDAIPLISFASQDGLCWKWGDLGSLTFFMPESDLAILNFSRCFVKLNSG